MEDVVAFVDHAVSRIATGQGILHSLLIAIPDPVVDQGIDLIAVEEPDALLASPHDAPAILLKDHRAESPIVMQKARGKVARRRSEDAPCFALLCDQEARRSAPQARDRAKRRLLIRNEDVVTIGSVVDSFRIEVGGKGYPRLIVWFTPG